MWPSRSKAIQEPSGERSADIHVPSVVVKSMSRVLPRASVTSQPRPPPVESAPPPRCAPAPEGTSAASTSEQTAAKRRLRGLEISFMGISSRLSVSHYSSGNYRHVVASASIEGHCEQGLAQLFRSHAGLDLFGDLFVRYVFRESVAADDSDAVLVQVDERHLRRCLLRTDRPREHVPERRPGQTVGGQHSLVHQVLRQLLVARDQPELAVAPGVISAVPHLHHKGARPDGDDERHRRGHFRLAASDCLGAYRLVRFGRCRAKRGEDLLFVVLPNGRLKAPRRGRDIVRDRSHGELARLTAGRGAANSISYEENGGKPLAAHRKFFRVRE